MLAVIMARPGKGRNKMLWNGPYECNVTVPCTHHHRILDLQPRAGHPSPMVGRQWMWIHQGHRCKHAPRIHLIDLPLLRHFFEKMNHLGLHG